MLTHTGRIADTWRVTPNIIRPPDSAICECAILSGGGGSEPRSDGYPRPACATSRNACTARSLSLALALSLSFSLALARSLSRSHSLSFFRLFSLARSRLLSRSLSLAFSLARVAYIRAKERKFWREEEEGGRDVRRTNSRAGSE